MAAGLDAEALQDTLVIVSCGKAKVWDRRPNTGSVPAREAYVSSLFRACRHYAEARGGEWAILSAKYGFLHPTQPISRYNVAFGTSEEAITIHAMRQQWIEHYQHIRKVISLCGKAYDAQLSGVLGGNVTLENPLNGKDLFKRMAVLKRMRLAARAARSRTAANNRA